MLLLLIVRVPRRRFTRRLVPIRKTKNTTWRPSRLCRPCRFGKSYSRHHFSDWGLWFLYLIGQLFFLCSGKDHVNPVKLLNLAFGGLILSKKIETYKLMSVPQAIKTPSFPRLQRMILLPPIGGLYFLNSVRELRKQQQILNILLILSKISL